MNHTDRELRQALERAYQALSPFSDSARWEFDNHLAHLRTATEILARLPQGVTVVDLGCNIGVLPLTLRILGYDASGNDKYLFYSKEFGNSFGYTNTELDVLKRIWDTHGLNIYSVDLTKEKAPQTYDLALSIATIEHQAYPRLFMESLISFVKNGGYLYVARPNAVKLANRFRILLGRPPMSNIDEFYKNAEYFNGHWREYTLAEVARMGMLSGLKVLSARVIQTEPVNFKLSRPNKWLRSIARLLGRYIRGTGDAVVVVFEKH